MDLIGLHLDDAREAEAQVAGALLGLQHVAQPQAPDAQTGHAFDTGIGVGRLVFAGAMAGGRLVLAVGGHLEAAGLPDRQRQIDEAVARVLRHVQRRRMIDILRHGEGRAVLQDAAAGRDRKLARRQQLAIDLEFGEAPGMRAQAADAAAHELLGRSGRTAGNAGRGGTCPPSRRPCCPRT